MVDSRSVFLCFPLLNNNIQLDYQGKMDSKQYLTYPFNVNRGLRKDGMMKNFRIEGQEIEPVIIARKILTSGASIPVVGLGTFGSDSIPAIRIAFNTKLFTAVAVGMLVEEGKLEWNKPIHQYVPTMTAQKDFIKREINFSVPVNITMHP